MKKDNFTQAICVLFAFCMAASACAKGTSNPRGVYRLISFIYSSGRTIPCPYEQYKLCSDSVTWQLVIENGTFSLRDNDFRILDYTGDIPSGGSDDKSTRIFDSGRKRFKLKWWSTYRSHDLFPQDDWLTEQYRRNVFTPAGRELAHVLTQPMQRSRRNPFVGHWKFVGTTTNDTASVERLLQQAKFRKMATVRYLAFTPTHFISSQDIVLPVSYDKDGTFSASQRIKGRFHDQEKQILLVENGNGTLDVWQRDTNPTALISKIKPNETYKQKLPNRRPNDDFEDRLLAMIAHYVSIEKQNPGPDRLIELARTYAQVPAEQEYEGFFQMKLGQQEAIKAGRPLDYDNGRSTEERIAYAYKPRLDALLRQGELKALLSALDSLAAQHQDHPFVLLDLVERYDKSCSHLNEIRTEERSALSNHAIEQRRQLREQGIQLLEERVRQCGVLGEAAKKLVTDLDLDWQKENQRLATLLPHLRFVFERNQLEHVIRHYRVDRQWAIDEVLGGEHNE